MKNQRCPHCGTLLHKTQDVEFCPNCGIMEEEGDSDMEEMSYVG